VPDVRRRRNRDLWSCACGRALETRTQSLGDGVIAWRLLGGVRSARCGLVAHPRQLVLLLRHGIAETPSSGRVDEERRLTVEGARVLAEVAAGMRALALPVEAIVSSPLRRARETAAIVAAAYHLEDRIDAERALAPGAGPDAAIAALAVYREATAVLLVGHQPNLGEIASTMLVGTAGLVPLPFGTAGLAGIAVTALPLRAPGVLEFFLTAEQACRIGRAVAGTG